MFGGAMNILLGLFQLKTKVLDHVRMNLVPHLLCFFYKWCKSMFSYFSWHFVVAAVVWYRTSSGFSCFLVRIMSACKCSIFLFSMLIRYCIFIFPTHFVMYLLRICIFVLTVGESPLLHCAFVIIIVVGIIIIIIILCWPCN